MPHSTPTLTEPRSSSHGGDLNCRRHSPPQQTSLRRSPRLHPHKNNDESSATVHRQPTPLRRSPRFASQEKNQIEMMKNGRSLRSNVARIKQSQGPNIKIQFDPIKKVSAREDQQRCLNKCHCEPLRRSPRFSGNSADGNDKKSCPRNEVMRSDRVLRSHTFCATKAVPMKDQANGNFVARQSLRIEKVISVGLDLKNGTTKHQTVNKLKTVEKEETKAGTKRRRTNACPGVSTPEDGKVRKKQKNGIKSNEGEEIDEDEVRNCSHVDGWTKEQDEALRRAYLTTKPSPNFWKILSKMVPGKSAQECFDRVHSHLATPIPKPRSRGNKHNISPIGAVTLLNGTPTEHVLPNSKVPKMNRRKMISRKMVRHLLRKHSSLDQNKQADFFSVFETSPMAFSVDIPEIETPGSSKSKLSSPCFLRKCNKISTSEHNKMLSRLRTEIPEVLKQIKNVALHERYIDHLRCRESKRRVSTKTVSSSFYLHCQNGLSKDMLTAAKTALMFEAKDVINQFQHKQANVVDNDEDLDLDSGSDTNDDE